MTTILLLAANPRNTPKLELYQEIYDIDQVVRSAKYGAQFRFVPKTAIKRSDLLKLIEDYNPEIIHFSGHGDSASAIYLENERGESELVSQEIIRDMFRHHKGNVKCVVFNACYLEGQANVVAEEINGTVVGMTAQIIDQMAIRFSKEFYRQLANGRDVLAAYYAARIQVDNGQELLRIHHPNVAASKIKFAKRTPFIVEIVGILLLALLVPLLSIIGFATIFYSFFQAIAPERENAIIWSVAFIGGILGIVCGITWNRYIRPTLLSFQ